MEEIIIYVFPFSDMVDFIYTSVSVRMIPNTEFILDKKMKTCANIRSV